MNYGLRMVVVGSNAVVIQTPVLFLTYKRLETSNRVFEQIRRVRPRKLFFASNGPNPENSDDGILVTNVRSLVHRVDWDCQIYTRFLNHHLNVRESIVSSLDWFFSHVDEGIILEDDCLPDISFFEFCERNLALYRRDNHVFGITGCNFLEHSRGQAHGETSLIYFSRFNHVWGWATWRRSWDKYDKKIEFWPRWSRSFRWQRFWSNWWIRAYWEIIFDRVYNGIIVTWDYQWLLCAWFNDGLTVTPPVNLVSNIGFGPEATNTSDVDSELANRPVGSLEIAYKKQSIAWNQIADQRVMQHVFSIRPQSVRYKFFILRMWISMRLIQLFKLISSRVRKL